MRLAPVPLFYARDARAAIEFAAESSRTTHGAQEAVDACRYFAALIVGALQDLSKEELLAGVFEPVPGIWNDKPLAPKILEVAKGSFKRDDPPTLSGTGGYVVPSLEVALWAFYKSNNFRDGALLAVNVGFDADTYGAIYGQLAGAYYGESGIPEEWRKVIAERKLITSLAERLFASSF
jgi:ADP-ribosylglycohydrolase